MLGFIALKLGYKLMLIDVRAVVLRLLWLWETAHRVSIDREQGAGEYREAALC